MFVFAPVFADENNRFFIDDTEFVYRVPETMTTNTHIMVLFGGRNWPGEKTLARFGFDALADTHSLMLVSPSFRDRDYWEPDAWSGAALTNAVRRLETQYGLNASKLYFYGYSAGGQCANLFYAWMPERVAAWGAHGCGVYFDHDIPAPAPALVTCGTDDAERLVISRQFVYRYREAGGALLWKHGAAGHELNNAVLDLARAWFDAVMSGTDSEEIGEDDTQRVVPAANAESVDPEFRNPLYSPHVKELWLR